MAFQTGLEDKPWHYGLIAGLLIGGGVLFAANNYLLEPKKEELKSLLIVEPECHFSQIHRTRSTLLSNRR